MPYFLYKIFPDRKLEKITAFEKFQEARKEAHNLRANMPPEADWQAKVIFAQSEVAAEALLKEKRKARPLGEDN